jgi:hypothetical protein
MSPPVHPLRQHLRLLAARQGITVLAAAGQVADALSTLGIRQADGTPVKPRSLLAYADGKRRPKPPFSEALARAIGVDELTLLKWGRSTAASNAA